MSAEFFRKFSILLISNRLGSAISSLDQNSSQSHNSPNFQRHNCSISQRQSSPISQRHSSPIAQRHSSPISQRHSSPISQSHNSPISQRHQIRDSKTQFLGNLLLSANESSSSSPGRPPTSCPGRRTKKQGRQCWRQSSAGEETRFRTC